MAYLPIICRYVVGGVLLTAAVRKALGRGAFVAFVGSVRRIGGVPARSAPAVAIAVVGVETSVGGALLAGLAPDPALLAAAAVLLAFTIVLVRELRGGSAPPCLCLGRREEPVAWRHVWRNCGLLALTAVGLAGSTGPAGRPTVAGTLLSLAAAGVVVIVIVALDDLAALFRDPA
jgi:uncharacterized membrane protein YphA (DoxX/SURF4 family)